MTLRYMWIRRAEDERVVIANTGHGGPTQDTHLADLPVAVRRMIALALDFDAAMQAASDVERCGNTGIFSC